MSLIVLRSDNTTQGSDKVFSESLNDIQDQKRKILDEIRKQPKASPEREAEFDKFTRETETLEERAIEELNKKHAMVHTSEFHILTEKPHPFVRGAMDFTLESRQSFLNTYENQTITCTDGKTRSVAQVWIKHPKRREFRNGIVFDPTCKGHKNGSYNIWQGFSVEAKKGNCELFKTHILNVICNGDKHYFNYVWGWLASLIQRPNEIATGLVLMGSQGTGKGKFVKEIGKLFGSHFVHLDNLERLLGNFNFHLKDAVLVFGDEAIWGGNKKDLGRLKAMVTEEYAMIEPKGKDPIQVRNFRHFILASNEDWPVHLDRDDRRFLVLRVSDKEKENFAYFKKIDNEMDNGGREALLYELLNEDISSFNPRDLPQNKEAFQIKLASASSVEQYIFESLNAGGFDIGNATPNSIWKEAISTDSLFADYTSWCNKQGILYEKQEKLGKALNKLIPSAIKSRPRVAHAPGGRQAQYQLPPLCRAKQEFQKAYKAGEEIWE